MRRVMRSVVESSAYHVLQQPDAEPGRFCVSHCRRRDAQRHHAMHLRRQVRHCIVIYTRPCCAAKLQSSRVMGIAEIRGEKTRHGLYVSACISVRYDKAIFNVRLKTDLFNS